MNNLQNNIFNLCNKISNLQNRRSNLQNNIYNLQNNIYNLQNNIYNLQTNIAYLQNNIIKRPLYTALLLNILFLTHLNSCYFSIFKNSFYKSHTIVKPNPSDLAASAHGFRQQRPVNYSGRIFRRYLARSGRPDSGQSIKRSLLTTDCLPSDYRCGPRPPGAPPPGPGLSHSFTSSRLLAQNRLLRPDPIGPTILPVIIIMVTMAIRVEPSGLRLFSLF